MLIFASLEGFNNLDGNANPFWKEYSILNRSMNLIFFSLIPPNSIEDRKWNRELKAFSIKRK